MNISFLFSKKKWKAEEYNTYTFKNVIQNEEKRQIKHVVTK